MKCKRCGKVLEKVYFTRTCMDCYADDSARAQLPGCAFEKTSKRLGIAAIVASMVGTALLFLVPVSLFLATLAITYYFQARKLRANAVREATTRPDQRPIGKSGLVIGLGVMVFWLGVVYYLVR